MKKILVFILSLTVFACGITPVYAESETLLDLLCEQAGQEAIDTLEAARSLDGAEEWLGGVNLKNTAVVSLYPDRFFLTEGKTTDELITYADDLYETAPAWNYLILGENPVIVRLANRQDPEGAFVTGMSFAEKMPDFVRDILENDLPSAITENHLPLKRVLVMGSVQLEDINVWYFTEGGTFLRVYEPERGVYQDFDEEGARAYFKEYLDYIHATYYDEEGNPLDGGGAESESLLDVLRQSVPQEIRDQLADAAKNGKSDSERWKTCPILVSYATSLFFEFCEKPTDGIFAALEDSRAKEPHLVDYYIYDKTFGVARVTRYKSTGEEQLDYRELDCDFIPWLIDLENNAVPQKVRESGKKISRIFCVDNSPEHFGTALFFVLEDGSFVVKFYGYDGQGKKGSREFEESEFRTYCKAFGEYLHSLNYDEEGNIRPVDGSTPFLSFVAETPFETLEPVSVATDDLKPWLWGIAAGGVLVLIAVAVFVFCKKKD